MQYRSWGPSHAYLCKWLEIRGDWRIKYSHQTFSLISDNFRLFWWLLWPLVRCLTIFPIFFDYKNRKMSTKNWTYNNEILNSHFSSLKKRINKIFYYYLKIVDKDLFIYLVDKVEPYLFLFRWILFKAHI